MSEGPAAAVSVFSLAAVQRDRERDRLEQDNYLDPSGSIVRANSNKETVEQLHTHLLAAAEDYRSVLQVSGAGAAEGGQRELLVGTAAAQKRKRRRKVKKDDVQSIGRTFVKVMEDSGMLEGFGRHTQIPSWVSCAGGAPIRPRRWFCAMCGAIGVYQCPICKTRFCCKKCNDAHKEVRCLKSVR